MRAGKRFALALLVSLGLAALAGAQSELVNPENVTYDPVTGTYYDASGRRTDPPPVPPFLQNRGWRRTAGALLSPNGEAVAPATLYPSPAPLDNPLYLSYEPATGKYFDADGRLVDGDLPQFMKNQGCRLDPSTGPVTGPSGAEVDRALAPNRWKDVERVSNGAATLER